MFFTSFNSKSIQNITMFSITRTALLRTPGASTYLTRRTMITAQAVVYSQHGEPKDVLTTHTYEIDESKLGPDQIVAQTLASPVNPSDINQIQGVYPSKPEKTTELGTAEPLAPCGNEGLFQVLHVGSGVSDLQPGDWCVPRNVNFGTWRTHALGNADEFFKIPNPKQSKASGKPNGLSINQGATLCVNPPTALLMLTHFVKLGANDWFIQNGGNSAVGKYAIQVARILGFNSLSVIRDRPDLDTLVDQLKQLGATRVITEEQNLSKEFGATIKDWTKGGEIKLALNCVGGKNATGVARKLAKNGLMLTYGGMSFQPVIIPTSLHIFKNITSAGFWVTELLRSDFDLKKKTFNQIIEWYEDGQLVDAPSVESIYDGSKPLHEVYQEAVLNSKNGKQLVVYK